MQNNINGLIDTIKMMFLMNSKENDIYNNFGLLFFITCLTFITGNDDCYYAMENLFKTFFEFISKIFLPKCNKIILEGKICMKVSGYITKTDNLFSNRFNAFWYHISTNNLNNKTIYSLKEYANSSNIYDDYGDLKKNKKKSRKTHYDDYFNDNSDEEDMKNKDIFIVDQNTHFKINDNIYCKVTKTIHDKGDEKKQSQYEMENIYIEIYSYKLSLCDLYNFIDKLDDTYQESLEKYRNDKKFIYTLIGSSESSERDYSIKWEECEFSSTRRFDNLFFENKKLLMNKLDFFVNNKSYYEREGHPYTFGIGLHGPPGTGKTSIIKCIANKLNRHIIVIPLSKIKTQREFSEYFFENYYSRNNTKKIDFKDKIIVFEDIDCMSEIVKKRTINKSKNSNINSNKNEYKSDKSDKSDNESIDIVDSKDESMEKTLKLQNKLLNKIAKKVDNEHEESMIVDFEKKDDKITLSFILNIIDGIRETPGRIMIITSNDYESLDPALVRPGRIDMTLEMKNATIDTIKEMYNHYYQDILDENIEKQLRDFVVSPAKLVNLRFENEKKEDFIVNLLKEF